MSSYPCKYLSTRKCCCCFNCDPRQVFLILSSTCLLLGLINMCSYPLCPAIIISSLVLAFYYFGCGIYLLYAITGLHEKLLRSFPWLMLFSYIPIAGYAGCVVLSIDCIRVWTRHYSLDEDPESAHSLFIGILCLYSLFALVDFMFSSYALMLSIGQLDDKPGSRTPPASVAGPTPYGVPFGMAVMPTSVAYATVTSSGLDDSIATPGFDGSNMEPGLDDSIMASGLDDSDTPTENLSAPPTPTSQQASDVVDV